MILHGLEVGGFRCFSSKVTLALDPEGINILHGKNGSGKSSLLWALIRGLLDTYRAGGKSVSALRPWGTDLGPTIVVEFEDQGKRYRLEKSFLQNKCARLAERQGAKLKPLANNEKAEERVREILLSETPTVGLTKPEKWGLARALWCPQEHLLVDGFDGRVLGSIQELLGKQAMNEAALALQNKVEKRYLEYWTPQGKPKGGKDAAFWVRRQSDLPKLGELLEECTGELDDLLVS
jgi:energy-coupling factor transporter ATP-binding protein EcfA2